MFIVFIFLFQNLFNPMYPFENFSLGKLKKITNNQHNAAGNPILYTLITRKYCEYLQKFTPEYITPNLITWIGLISMLTSFGFTMALDWTLKNPPRVLHLINAFTLFIYLTTDSLDGIHARVTKKCSPIGKILDHFIDSCNMPISFLTLCSSLKLGYSSIFFMISICGFAGFYIAELIEKFTGYLRFGFISGASEGIYLMIFVHLIAFIKPDFFKSFIEIGNISNIYFTVMIIYLTYITTDMINEFIKNKNTVNFKQAALSFGRLMILILLFSSFFFLKIQGFYSHFTFFLIFLESFSICYLEEYISSMSGSSVRVEVFIISYMLLSLKIFHFIFSNSSNINTILLVLSTLNFVLRSGSILRDLSVQLDIKLFTSKF